jgi:hypothetical protein
MQRSWREYNELYAEDDDEIAERQRLARIKSRCPECGKNPKLGYPHDDGCSHKDGAPPR